MEVKNKIDYCIGRLESVVNAVEEDN